MKKLSTTVFIFLLIGSLSSASAEVIELRYSTYLGTEFEEGIMDRQWQSIRSGPPI